MPGSLLLGTDAYSDVSDLSGRSLDSKIGGKRVSFNKSVRVKQYPWKPDLEVHSSEHLTLPSNRFWFKVYKTNPDSPISYDYTTGKPKHNAWEEENMECIHDSLAPIAEVEDRDIDGSPRHTNEKLNGQSNFYLETSKEKGNYTNGDYVSYNHHPIDPPVDYFDQTRLVSNRAFSGIKQVWGANNSSKNQNEPNVSHSNSSNQCNNNGIGYPNSSIEEKLDNSHFYSSPITNNNRFSRSNFKNDSSTRRSVRKLEGSDNFTTRERRSRSHDDYMDNDNRFMNLRKADKSVSTEDLNSSTGHLSHINRFFKGSRDIATQCHGTLTRKQIPNFSNMSSSSLQTNSFIAERLNNFKSPTSKINYPDSPNNNTALNLKKDYSLEKLSSINRPRVEGIRTNNFSKQTEKNHKPNSYESKANAKVSGGNIKPLARTENSISDIMHSQANKTYNRFNQKSDWKSIPVLSEETKKYREKSYQSNNSKESNTVGYLRGRQIPLSEVNTNTNRKILSKNNFNLNPYQNSCKSDENHIMPKNLSSANTSNGGISKGYQSKKFLSPTNNHERRSFRQTSNSATSYASSFSDGGGSMIDWSLSGFQLASKPENGIKSISDSEYTVHRRPPLLMYIPGVSHHDRPAIEDDRLSALSDISRAETNDGLSSFASANSGKIKNGIGEFHRRQSMREGKSKWLKWRNKS